jgi:hypothetical protein
MFDGEQVAELDAAGTISVVSETHRLVLEQECLLVQLAAHWCDLHSPDSQPATERIGRARNDVKESAGRVPPKCSSSPPPSWARS